MKLFLAAAVWDCTEAEKFKYSLKMVHKGIAKFFLERKYEIYKNNGDEGEAGYVGSSAYGGFDNRGSSLCARSRGS